MFCTNCGKDIKDGLKFCTNCGSPVVDVKPRKAATTDADRLPSAASESAPMVSYAPTYTPQTSQSAVNPEPSATPAPALDLASAYEATSVMPASAVDPASDASRVEAPPAKKKKSGYGKIAAILLFFVVVAAIGIGVYFYLSGQDDHASTTVYGSTQIVSLARDSKIIPQDKDGNPLETYTVSIVPLNATAQEEKERVKNGEFSLYAATVRGTEGFELGSIKGGLPTGSYAVTIQVPTDDGQEKLEALPRVAYEASDFDEAIQSDESNRLLKELTVTYNEADSNKDGSAGESANGTVSERTCAMLYYTKCMELVDTYGVPKYTNATGGANPLYGGLCLAQLVDFDGDGTDELFTVINTGSKNDGKSAAYKVLIFGYADGALEQLWEGPSDQTNNGIYRVGITKDGSKYAFYIQEDISGSRAGSRTTVYEYSDGGFAKIHEFEDYGMSRIVADGKAVDGATYDAAVDKWVAEPLSQGWTLISLYDDGSDDDCIETTFETLDKLYALMKK